MVSISAFGRARILLLLAFLGPVACTVTPPAESLRKPATAAEGSPVFARFTGNVAPGTETTVVLELHEGDLAVPSQGALIAFSLAGATGSGLDPGVIDVRRHGSTAELGGGPRKSDVAGAKDSLSLAKLTPGTFDIVVRGERGTGGPYQLDIALAGDANGDFRVDQTDVAGVSSRMGRKLGEPGYQTASDVDRNGVINGGDLERVSSNLGASTSLRVEVDNPLDQPVPEGALKLVGLSPDSFNDRSTPVKFALDGASFYQSAAEVALTINGTRVPATQVTVDAHSLTGPALLKDGKNQISLQAVDDIGRSLFYQATVWAGSSPLAVRLVGESGQPFTTPTSVTVRLSDDQTVSMTSETSTGTATFASVPFRTVLVEAKATDNSYGLVGVIGTQGSVQIRMLGFGVPSTIPNNDFQQGTSGWTVGNAPVQIVPHQEGPFPKQAAALPTGNAAALAAPLERSSAHRKWLEKHPAAGAEDLSLPSQPSFAAAPLADNDLVLSTAGEGEKAISRTFTTSAGTTTVRVRYRFITTEVPGGYFGSQFNDYFRVTIRSQTGGGAASESNSMNGLGLAAFDFASGATAWRNATLPVDVQGDTIRVDVTVANVGDGLFDSRVVVDFVEEVKDQVRPSLKWNDTAGGMDLSFEVVEGDLMQDTTIRVSWASGPSYTNRIGDPFFSYVVPAGTTKGPHGPVRIAGSLLAEDPDDVTHIIAASSETSVGALSDVEIGYGPNANAAVVWSEMLDLLKDGLRAAGRVTGTISRTAATPADQARAMFQNLTNPANPVSANVTAQLGIYAPAGDAVINVFVAQTQGMTPQQIVANQTAIRAAMEQEIIAQGPVNVSHHCADPDVINVVDVGANIFNTQNGPLFVDAVEPRASRFIDERAKNGCYHVELE